VIRTALTLAQKGLAVFPCRQRSKLPATEHGFLDASKDPEIVERWWRADPDYNIGIATGKISNIFAIDVDGLDAEVELRRLEAAHGALPPTVEAITARGRHVYFRMPDDDVRNSAGKIAPGVDVRGTGGYVLAPPSVHPSGRRYAWSVDSAGTVAAAPDWLVTKAVGPAVGNGAAAPPTGWAELIAEGVDEGARDDTLTRLAGYLLRRHVEPDVAQALLGVWNSARCSPPLPDKDIARIVNSILRKETTRRKEAPQWPTSST
jgi:hypothetical protein